uniref:Transmembrane protein n=1 Tax=Medicago truncatula TaxID=3880 RepID=A2Q2Z9_MEDTR|nr:hypothetical protein MtrDRAFT_AC153128g25v2 [Medicago truncatula]
MAMALNSALYIAKMAWIALSGWITSCLTIADEFATSLRSGDIGPFHDHHTTRPLLLSRYELLKTTVAGSAHLLCCFTHDLFKRKGKCCNLYMI